MRNRLFKAKRLDPKDKWIEGQLIKTYFDGKLKYAIQSSEVQFETLPIYSIFPETICQYIGILDKDGDKIFECDEVETMGTKGTVYYDNEAAMFLIRFKSSTWSFDSIESEIKIIGNIHN